VRSAHSEEPCSDAISTTVSLVTRFVERDQSMSQGAVYAGWWYQLAHRRPSHPAVASAATSAASNWAPVEAPLGASPVYVSSPASALEPSVGLALIR
jgi:hypothetical protein